MFRTRWIGRLTLVCLSATLVVGMVSATASSSSDDGGMITAVTGKVEMHRPDGVVVVENIAAWVTRDGRWRVLATSDNPRGLTTEWVHDGESTTLSSSSSAGEVLTRSWEGSEHFAVADVLAQTRMDSAGSPVTDRAATVEFDAEGNVVQRTTLNPKGTPSVVERYAWDAVRYDESLLEPSLVADEKANELLGAVPHDVGLGSPVTLSGGAKSHGTTLLSAVDYTQCAYIYNSRDPEQDWLYGKTSRRGTCIDVEVRLWRNSQVMNIGFCQYGGTLIGAGTGTYTATKSTYSAYVSPTCTSHDAYDEDGFHAVLAAGYETRDWSD